MTSRQVPSLYQLASRSPGIDATVKASDADILPIDIIEDLRCRDIDSVIRFDAAECFEAGLKKIFDDTHSRHGLDLSTCGQEPSVEEILKIDAVLGDVNNLAQSIMDTLTRNNPNIIRYMSDYLQNVFMTPVPIYQGWGLDEH